MPLDSLSYRHIPLRLIKVSRTPTAYTTSRACFRFLRLSGSALGEVSIGVLEEIIEM